MTLVEEVRAAAQALAISQKLVAESVELIRTSAAVIELLAVENSKLHEEKRRLLAEMAGMRGGLRA